MLSWGGAGFWGATGMGRGKRRVQLAEGMLHGAEGLVVVTKLPRDCPVCPRRRLSSAGALQHPWLRQPQPSSTKALSKERIKQFLTRRKWQVPGAWMRTWGWGRLRWGSVLRCFSPENRQSPAGPQQADPAVPERRQESVRG